MSGDDFFLTLPSAASMEVYSNNRPSNYSTVLPRSIRLTGKWEVGLSEIHIPKYRLNITDKNNKFMVNYVGMESGSVKGYAPKDVNSVLAIDMDLSATNNIVTRDRYFHLLDQKLRALNGQVPLVDKSKFPTVIVEPFHNHITVEYLERDLWFEESTGNRVPEPPPGASTVGLGVTRRRDYIVAYRGTSQKGARQSTTAGLNERWNLLYDISNPL